MPIIPIKLFQMVKVLVYDALDSKTLILFRMVIKNLIPNKVSFIPYKLGYLMIENNSPTVKSYPFELYIIDTKGYEIQANIGK